MNTDEFEQDILAEPDDPSWFTSLANGFSLLQANAWFIVTAAAIIYYVWKEKLSHKYYKWREDRQSAEISAKMKKEPELFINREEARISAIRRLQEEYDRQACKVKEIEKEKENKKKEEILTKHKLTGGRKLNDDYYPLAAGNLNSYRASRRTCSSGSCGRRN